MPSIAMLWAVVCDGCKRHMAVGGLPTSGPVTFNMDDSNPDFIKVPTFPDYGAAIAAARAAGWSVVPELGDLCPDCGGKQ